MKTLLTAAIVLTLSGAAIAQSEVPEDTIPGYGVTIMPASDHQQMVVTSENRSESLAYSVPGYGETASGRIFSQPTVGSSSYDYLGYEFEGNQ